MLVITQENQLKQHFWFFQSLSTLYFKIKSDGVVLRVLCRQTVLVKKKQLFYDHISNVDLQIEQLLIALREQNQHYGEGFKAETSWIPPLKRGKGMGIIEIFRRRVEELSFPWCSRVTMFSTIKKSPKTSWCNKKNF